MFAMLAYAGLFVLGGVWIVLFWRLVASVRKFRISERPTLPADPPTVSVCIPARNEMHALAECLERVLASNYPKMEILVLDDESHDDTPIIIKSFAHAGVRFIPGTALPEGWLGKNYALDTLAREASGSLVMFMDVDTFISPNTISRLVGYAADQKKDMMSVIPRRADVGRASVFFGTLRYFWQLVRRPGARVAASSSLWLIRREALMKTIGGFEKFKEVVEPESAIAAQLGESYACLLGGDIIEVSYEKRWSSQVETSRRLLYPLFGQRFIGAVAGTILLCLLNLPTFLVLGIFASGWNAVSLLAVLILALYLLLYAVYLRQVWRSKWWLGVVLWPIVIFQELVLFIMSVVGYAGKTITWKNRPIRTDR
jgi:glycosyltransferase involved in cell wall biosynthesis